MAADRAVAEALLISSFAQVSDLHVIRGSSRDGDVMRAIAQINAAAPQFVIATGDLTQSGNEAEYRHLRELLQHLCVPYFLLPGNHDDREALRLVFRDHACLFETSPHIAYEIAAGSLRVLALDSTKPGRAGGYLDQARLDWLRARLARDSQRPVIIATHHPPFNAGVWPLDWLGYVNVRRLAEIVAESPHVERIISGHVHCARAVAWSGTFACTAPSPRSQLLLRSTERKPLSFTLEQGGFLMHTYEPDSLITTRVQRLDGTVEELRVFGLATSG
jgi:3',5'-cyclic-AMP phosphodiesterase